MSCFVVKISGHLIRDTQALKNLLNEIEKLVRENTKIVVVPGGSVFADYVREIQKEIGFNDDIAHWMAIKAMELYGIYIKHLSKSLVEAYTIEEIIEAFTKNLIPVAMPHKIMRQFDETPHTWDVTSDSISIVIASKLKCKLVCLAKMVDGIINNRGELVERLKADDVENMNQQVVDRYVPKLVKKYGISVAIFNATKPWILRSIVSGLKDEYTLIIP